MTPPKTTNRKPLPHPPGILFPRGPKKILAYQAYIPGLGLKKASTHTPNETQAWIRARELYDRWTLLSATPDAQLLYSRASAREVARIKKDVSERQSLRVSDALNNFLEWMGRDPSLTEITTDLLDRYQIHRLAQSKAKPPAPAPVPAAGLAPTTVTKKTAYVARLLDLSDKTQPLPDAIAAIRSQLERDANPLQAHRFALNCAEFLTWSGIQLLTDLTPALLAAWRQHLLTHPHTNPRIKPRPPRPAITIAEGTVSKELDCILRLLRNNGLAVDRPQYRAGRSAPWRPFTPDELIRFFAASDTYPYSDPEHPDGQTPPLGYYTPIFLAILVTGARPAELIPSPRSEHVPLLKTELDPITDTVTLRSAKVVKSRRTKNKRGPLVSRITIPHPVMETLLAAAKRTPGPHVFPKVKNLAHIFDAILHHAGIPKTDPLGQALATHSLRHNYGTLLAQQGINAFVIQNLMRHSDPRMTARYTAHATTAAIVDLTAILPLTAIEGGKPS